MPKNHRFPTACLALAMALLIPCQAFGQAAGATVQEPEPGMAPPLPFVMPYGVPAFPGAWGGGMFTTGGRGGKVIAVTSLSNSGPGSLREALEAEGPRIVVFRVAGVIELESNLEINHPNITIAGQSAPGDGVCLAYASLDINTHNVVVRHLRVRRGLTSGGQGSDNIGGHPEHHVIVDHCTASWGRDENLSLYRRMAPMPDPNEPGKITRVKGPVSNLTIQYCISSEGMKPGHEFGGTWGGVDSTFHHNLFACNTGRNPSIGMSGEFDYRNNVIFNWRHRTMDGGDETSLINVINNYYKPGPATNDNMLSTIARIEQRDMYSPSSRFRGDWYPQTDKRAGKWYVAGNLVEGHADVTADNWKGMKIEGSAQDLEHARVHTPFEGWPVNQQTATEAFEDVLAKAGATLPRRDPVDKRVVQMVRSGEVTHRNGIVSDPDQVGGYPEYAADENEIPADQDGDGMPDAWEKKHGLDPASASDGSQDSDNDGYTNVEEYLNGTDPTEKVDYTDLANNVDTIS
ncbi:hypothetical protein Mal64_04810 [Pseudobythopirellula maris]|uniref:Pectate lyase n=1 Tax=Pseudobythopirellula maris TaxID=2527991 RepID=A0A5C5ZSQ4_9BACT|nr:thrombospondin type 3 repeat-containing protein [Pseudobythopirellula maris]TWT90098.1 hypothetical protein Mal64_04810 [Pseudobythopirellula maris]